VRALLRGSGIDISYRRLRRILLRFCPELYLHLSRLNRSERFRGVK